MAQAPFHDRDGVIWFDGRMVPWRDARVHVLTHGLHYASSVFEGERVYGGRVFKLTEHTERLDFSAKTLGMKLPFTVAELDEATNAVIKANGIADGYVRPVAWRGSEMMGVSAQANTIHVAIAAHLTVAMHSPVRTRLTVIAAHTVAVAAMHPPVVTDLTVVGPRLVAADSLIRLLRRFLVSLGRSSGLRSSCWSFSFFLGG